MKRRDFIINSLITAGGAALLGGCVPEKKDEQAGRKSGMVARKKFKDIELPMLGFGCMRLPMRSDDESEVDMAEFEKMADYAMKHGVNYFDTAYMYVGGKSENRTGEILKNFKRDSFYLADKNPLMHLHSKEDVIKIFNEQLKKCNVDYFDFYLAHNINQSTFDNFKNYDVYNQLLQLKKDGKIKYLGFSFHGNTPILKEVVQGHEWDFCQLQINYLDWEVMNAKQHYEIAEKAGIPVTVMEPIRGGGLCKLSDKAMGILKKSCPDQTPASLALRWCASLPNVIVSLSGMSNFKQMEENIATFADFKPVTDAEKSAASQIAKVTQSQGEINCTACKYCLEGCPKEINIPAIFSIYNNYKATGSPWSLSYYNSLDDSEKADKCIKCGVCVKHCPQSLPIPDLLEKVLAEVKAMEKK